MRRLLVWGSVSLALCFSVSAQQRAVAPAFIPAPTAAPHAAPSPAPTHAAALAHPARSTGSKPSTATTSTRQKPIPKPSPIIVPPVSSITTTTAGPCRGVGPAFGSYNACPSPVVGGGGGIYGGAYYIPIPYYYGAAADAGPDELPPATQDINQMIANDEAVPRPDDVPLQPQPAGPPSGMGAGEINKALAEFVFVNRDGTKFNAVAYSFVNDKLQYVTKEGVRHSLPLDSLDLEATQKLNEQLGNTINLPNLPASGVALNQPVSNLK